MDEPASEDIPSKSKYHRVEVSVNEKWPQQLDMADFKDEIPNYKHAEIQKKRKSSHIIST
jgi:hypothetical protein